MRIRPPTTLLGAIVQLLVISIAAGFMLMVAITTLVHLNDLVMRSLTYQLLG